VMIGANQSPAAAAEQVEVSIRAASPFAVTVTGRVEAEEPGFEDIGLDPWALLRGISEDLTVTEDQGTTTLQMSWGR